MSFDVRSQDYVSVGPGTPVVIGDNTLSTSYRGGSPVTNLANGNVYVRELWESLYQKTEDVGPGSDRLAAGYRLSSDFRGFTNAMAVPMVWDVNIAAQASVEFQDVTNPRSGPVTIGVWLHVGEVDGTKITGGRSSVLGLGKTSVMSIEGEERGYVNCSLNFNKSVVVYPAFLAFQAAPLALAVVVSYPVDDNATVDGFTADFQCRLYSSVQKVFDPAQQ